MTGSPESRGADADMSALPLHGLKVLDFSRVLAGPRRAQHPRGLMRLLRTGRAQPVSRPRENFR
ncbi:hypothetical protein AB4Z48_36230 [Cupriavidus sp. 2TAF22]|uniref:hypothetical protein n=1 Tax=unclassified Cupriavidus TaxID=2640874 RepID=UPI003F919D73